MFADTSIRLYFYPRPPRGGRLRSWLPAPGEIRFLSTPSARRATPPGWMPEAGCSISIHALREEGDLYSILNDRYEDIFLSTPSARRATAKAGIQYAQNIDFYPRPPRGGRQFIMVWRFQTSNFYPRPPRGGRHEAARDTARCCVFLSTPSARRATTVTSMVFDPDVISIHALREEGDATQRTKEAWPTYFYPRPPRGGRPGSRHVR